MTDDVAATKVPRWPVIAVLMAALFAVAVGYGVVLPILPFAIERLAGTGDPAAVSRQTGMLTGTFTLALFLFAPGWGRLADRLGRRIVILLGLVGFALTLAAFGFLHRLAFLYLSRFLNGLFASAITPAAYAVVGDWELPRAVRAHRFALLNTASAAGFLAGPLLGGLVLAVARSLPPQLAAFGVPLSFVLAAMLALFAAPFIWRLPSDVRPLRDTAAAPSSRGLTMIRDRLLAIALMTALAVGAFEVGLSLRGKQVLGLGPYQIGLMFMECSLVMFVAQGVVLSPLVKPESTRRLFVPALALLAAGLAAVPFAGSYLTLVFAVGLIAATAGILSPIDTYWISLIAGESQGAELGLQTAAASLGQALGSAIAGLLFGVAALPGAAFTVPAATVLAGLAAAFSVQRLLTRADKGSAP